MKYEINLKQLTLKGFKGFKDLITMTFDSQLTVFIGDNGSGKSAILEAIAQHLMYLRHEITGGVIYEFPTPLNPKKLKNYDVNNESEALENKLLLDLDFPLYEEDMRSIDSGHVEMIFRANQDTSTDFENFNVDETLSEEEKKEQREEQDKRLNMFVFGLKNHRLTQQLNNTPVFVYYGCNSITTDINEEEEELLQLDIFDTYRQSLEANEFNFKQLTLLLDRQQKISLQNPKNSNGFLTYLEKAISTMLSDDSTSTYKNLHIEWGARFDETVIDKIDPNGHVGKLVISQLSSGEKTLLGLVADLTRRLYLANRIGNPLEGVGIVLIDEVDLHLHPNWQRKVVLKLMEIFPNVQFVVTTHSPLVLSNIYSKHIRIIADGKVYGAEETFGQSVNDILEDNMHTESSEFGDEIKKLFELIDANDISEAKALKIKLEGRIEGTRPELVKANAFIQRKELVGK